MSNNQLAAACWGFVLVVAVVGLGVFNFWLADRRLRQWKQQQNVQILWKQVRWIRRGPFRFLIFGSWMVYRVRVLQPDGYDVFGWLAASTSIFSGGVRAALDGASAFPVITQGDVGPRPNAKEKEPDGSASN